MMEEQSDRIEKLFHARQPEKEWIGILCSGFRLYALKQFDAGRDMAFQNSGAFLKQVLSEYIDRETKDIEISGKKSRSK